MSTNPPIELFEERLCAGPRADPERPPSLLIELPHGATRRADLEACRALDLRFPDSLETIFWCTTDQGAPELGARLAELLCDPQQAEELGLDPRRASRRSVRLLRALMPRHLLDLNRTWEPSGPNQGLTAVVAPQFLDQSEALQLLGDLHRRYREQLTERYDTVCAAGGLGFQLHTYSPRSVGRAGRALASRAQQEGWEQLDRAEFLRRAWSDGVREHWPRRPPAQLIISRRGQPPMLSRVEVGRWRDAFRAIHLELAVDHPFCLQPGQMLNYWAHRWPRQVFALEIGRTLLAADYDPLGPWAVHAGKLERVLGAVACALGEQLQRRGG